MKLTDEQKQSIKTKVWFYDNAAKNENIYIASQYGGIVKGIVETLEYLGIDTRFIYEDDAE